MLKFCGVTKLSVKKIKDIIVNFGIAFFKKKTIQKRIIYPLVLLLMLTPFLYFADGVQADGNWQKYSEERLQSENQWYRKGKAATGHNMPGQHTFAVKRAADVWYETGRNMREPERTVRRSSITYSNLYVDTDNIQFYQKETKEYFKEKKIRRLPEHGRSNWSLRAPPVVC